MAGIYNNGPERQMQAVALIGVCPLLNGRPRWTACKDLRMSFIGLYWPPSFIGHRVADADGWCTARVSMKQMTSLYATGASSPAELDVTPILHFTFWANVQLALSEITVDSGSAATP